MVLHQLEYKFGASLRDFVSHYEAEGKRRAIGLVFFSSPRWGEDEGEGV